MRWLGLRQPFWTMRRARMAEQKGEGTRVSDDCSSPTRDCVAPDFLTLRERDEHLSSSSRYYLRFSAACCRIFS